MSYDPVLQAASLPWMGPSRWLVGPSRGEGPERTHSGVVEGALLEGVWLIRSTAGATPHLGPVW